MTGWTHALRRPGPQPDRCRAIVDNEGECGCDNPEPSRQSDAICGTCEHELVPKVSERPSDSPEPPR